MRHIASIEVEDEPAMDTIIVWDDGHRFVAYAYQHGQVMRTSPLEAATPAAAIREAGDAFGVSQTRWRQREQAARWR